MNARHSLTPDASFDGGDLDCGGGLLLLIRRHIDPLPPGGLLEICSSEPTVETDLPAWCRMTGNELISVAPIVGGQSFLVCKGSLTARLSPALPPASRPAVKTLPTEAESTKRRRLALPRNIPSVEPLSVMGIGSWPRPRWMLQAMHDHLASRLGEAEFQETASDAVRLCVSAQVRAGVDVITDGEQRRDSYASFVGGLLENCQLIPITDLLPYVDDPEEFERELRALDVPAGEVRHPAVFGPLIRQQPLAVHEFDFTRTLTEKPIKIALPGPYLLTRTMWMECISDRAYETRESLARDVVRVLQEELNELLAAGVAIVQFDEPILTEVVLGAPQSGRSFMCGALSAKREPPEELAFAADLICQVIEGAPRERVALHMCRGNWSRNEGVALHGDYRPLVTTLQSIPVGIYFLELCTPRAGEIEVLRDLPEEARVGVGVVNQKLDRIETVDEIVSRGRQAIDLFGRDRVLFNPDCGFATFADNPVASAVVAEAKLTALVQAAEKLKGKRK